MLTTVYLSIISTLIYCNIWWGIFEIIWIFKCLRVIKHLFSTCMYIHNLQIVDKRCSNTFWYIEYCVWLTTILKVVVKKLLKPMTWYILYRHLTFVMKFRWHNWNRRVLGGYELSRDIVKLSIWTLQGNLLLILIIMIYFSCNIKSWNTIWSFN